MFFVEIWIHPTKNDSVSVYFFFFVFSVKPFEFFVVVLFFHHKVH